MQEKAALPRTLISAFDIQCLTIVLAEFTAIGVAPITQLRACVIQIATFKGGNLMW